jgi:hypothetical protein
LTTRLYVDSSALLKRVLVESEQESLLAFLEQSIERGVELHTSALASVEVSRILRSRLDIDDPFRVLDNIGGALTGVFESPISEQVISVARRLGPATLRSLDAIHLATATILGVDQVCSYDKRMLVSAAELGFATSSPA